MRRIEHEEATARTAADELEGEGRWKEAAPYRALVLKAIGQFSQIAGLVQQRLSISREAEPRSAGLWRALWEVLGEVDAELREREAVDARRLATFLGAVERLTGGPLPAEVVALVARTEATPAVVDTVRAAVRRYEERIGARAASLGTGGGG